MKKYTEYYDKIVQSISNHEEWFRNSIPLIASENVSSLAVRKVLTSDFGHRYAEGWPGERVYAGCTFLDQVELTALELAKRFFRAEFADVRPISGAVANLAVYTAFTDPGDLLMALSIPSGGHISMGKKNLGGTAGAVHGLNVEYLTLNEKEMNIDVDETVKKTDCMLKEGKQPKLVMFGGSVLLFPHPLRDLEKYFHDIGATVGYDAAHVSGLIGSGVFQDPLQEGADVMSLSTHKTLPGPQHGMIVSMAEHAEKIKKATFPGVVSNHHLHHVAGVAIALAEMLEFGKEYSTQIIRNAQALGQALYEQGFKVLAEHKGFTKSHVLMIDITDHGDGGTVEKELEKANILLNRNLLPWDIRCGRHFTNPGGIRIGTSEVTRLGMKENNMKEIARFISQVIMEGKSPEKVKEEVTDFRKDFQKVHYCFDE